MMDRYITFAAGYAPTITYDVMFDLARAHKVFYAVPLIKLGQMVALVPTSGNAFGVPLQHDETPSVAAEERLSPFLPCEAVIHPSPVVHQEGWRRRRGVRPAMHDGAIERDLDHARL